VLQLDYIHSVEVYREGEGEGQGRRDKIGTGRLNELLAILSLHVTLSKKK